MVLKFWGGSQTVSGNRTEIRWGKNPSGEPNCALVDCGLFQGPKELRLRNWQEFPKAQNIKFILLTHAHVDHSGLLPRIVQQGFKGPIFCSEATAELCEIMLMDSACLQEEDAEFANKTRHSKHFPALPLYTQEDARRALQLFKPLPLHESHLVGEGFQVKFRSAGHILGACSIQIEITEDQTKTHRILFSGDIGNSASFIMNPPEPLPNIDYLIIESTYGNRCHPKEDREQKLADVVNAVCQRGGTLVIPAFAVGRTQELLFLLTKLETQQRIPKIPKYLDSPMAKNTTQIYLRHIEDLRKNPTTQLGEAEDMFKSLSGEGFYFIGSSAESRLLCENKEPKIVVAASGMLQGGRILHHLKHVLPDAKNGVLFVGYQGEGTKGALLKNGINRLRIHHELIDIQASIFSIEGFSAHADSQEILDWLNSLKLPPQITFVNHGEPAAAAALAYRIQTELQWKSQVPKYQEEFLIS